MRTLEERIADTNLLLMGHLFRIWLGKDVGHLFDSYCGPAPDVLVRVVHSGKPTDPFVAAHFRACDRRRLRKAKRNEWTLGFRQALADPELSPALLWFRELFRPGLLRLVDELQGSALPKAEPRVEFEQTWDDVAASPEKLWDRFKSKIFSLRRQAIERELEGAENAGTVLAGYLFRLSRADAELANERLVADMGLPLEPARLFVAAIQLLVEDPEGFVRRTEEAIQLDIGRTLPGLVFGHGSSSLDSAHRRDLSLDSQLGESAGTLNNVLRDPEAEEEFERVNERIYAVGMSDILEVDIAKLPAAERRAVELKVEAEESDLTFEEVVKRHGLNSVNERRALSRARKKFGSAKG